MNNILKQLKKRRKALGLKQNDMMMRIGVSRQQYQRLESKGNPRLDTLQLIAKGLKSEFLLIPQEKFAAVKAILENDDETRAIVKKGVSSEGNTLVDDPWKDLLGG
jgi:transcriptional regulator with XRE-family HTH domain